MVKALAIVGRPKNHAVGMHLGQDVVGGMGLISEILHDIAPANCRSQLEQINFDPRDLDDAKRLHRLLLPDVAEVDAVHTQLRGMLCSAQRCPISHGQALKMLNVLFRTLSHKKDHETEALRLSCADLFNPVSDVIGKATGLWKPANKHPAVLAIAVRTMIAAGVFAPVPKELLAEMKRVESRLWLLLDATRRWLDLIDKVDAITFAADPAWWHAAYANVSSDVVLGMLRDEPDEPAPRWAALNRLWEAKDDAAEELPQLADESSNKIAACTAPPAKRTRKPIT
jgi:hypothetical protein